MKDNCWWLTFHRGMISPESGPNFLLPRNNGTKPRTLALDFFFFSFFLFIYFFRAPHSPCGHTNQNQNTSTGRPAHAMCMPIIIRPKHAICDRRPQYAERPIGPIGATDVPRGTHP